MDVQLVEEEETEEVVEAIVLVVTIAKDLVILKRHVILSMVFLRKLST